VLRGKQFAVDVAVDYYLRMIRSLDEIDFSVMFLGCGPRICVQRVTWMEMDLSRAVFCDSASGGDCRPGAGQGSLEVIPLRHRTADQVLPALRPLMEPERR
jgi:hypothetical protein